MIRYQPLSDKGYLEDPEIDILVRFLSKLESHGSKIALSTRESSGWRNLSYSEMFTNIHKIGTFFLRNNLGHKKKIAILSDSCNEYSTALLGVLVAGSTSIPIDHKLSAHEIASILNHSEADAILLGPEFYDDKKNKIFELCNKPIIPFLIEGESTDKNVQSLFRLTASEEILKEYPLRKNQELAIITYTSGTTGDPKGVMISFRNLYSQVLGLSDVITVEDKRFLSLLPLNHMFELITGCLYPLYLGCTVYYGKTILPTQMIDIFCEKKITHLISVPLILEAFKNGITRKVNKLPLIKKTIFKALRKISPYLKRSLRKRIFSKIHDQFGGNIELFLSGGAPLSPQTYDFFNSLGFKIIQGYGLSETAPISAINYLKENRSFSVGKSFPGIQIKIDESGIIHIKGPNVMLGYYKNKELTDTLIDQDGWFNTGDIGHFDVDDFLCITGREKNLIVLKGGKKVHPEEVESVFSQNKLVKETLVMGYNMDDQENVGCILVPEEGVDHAKLMAEIEKYRVQISDYKWPRKFIIQIDELPKTTTKKIARKKIINPFT